MSWPKVEFQDLFLVPSRNGLTRPARVRGSGFKMINMGELFAHDRIGSIEMELVPMSEKDLQTSLVEEKDLLFARQSLVLSGAGKCSLVKQVNEPTTFESHIIRVRLDSARVHPEFYYYYFNSPTCGIRSIVTQGVQAGIRGNDLKNLSVHEPPLKEQERIASILSAYDDLIENNRRRIALLEQAARLLYREWFVHYRFPGHETATFVDGLPEGWSEQLLSDLCTEGDGIQTGPFGSQLHQSDYSEDGVPVVMPKNMKSGKVDLTGIARIPEELADKLGRHRMMPGDTVFGRRGEIGRKAFIGEKQAGYFCGTGCLRIRPIPDKINPRFLFESLGSPATAGFIVNQAKGSTMPNLSASALKKVPILCPSDSIQSEYTNKTTPLLDQIELLDAQNAKLAKARDLLLPRLIDGRISVDV